MTGSLDIALLHRPGERFPGGASKTERWSIDFLVGGRSLFGLIKEGDWSGAFVARRDPLRHREKINAEQKVLFSTFGPKPKRLALYVCPECGDLGCGAMTCDIARVGDKVIWSRFGLDNGYAEPDFESYAHIGPFEFDIREYLAVIERATAGEA